MQANESIGGLRGRYQRRMLEIRGAFESRGGERVRVPGALESFELSVEDAEALILKARVAAGWIEADPEPEVEPEEVETAEPEEV